LALDIKELALQYAVV